MSPIILLAETGSDITPEIAQTLNIRLVPMHVSMDAKTYDDGTFHGGPGAFGIVGTTE